MTKHAMILILPIFFLLCAVYCHFTTVLPVLKRLRWLFLSLLILNLWFNSPELRWLPTSENLIFALERVGALVIIVLAAHLLIQVTPSQEMTSALQWWFAPLQKMGFPSEKLAIRLMLVLDTVQRVQKFYEVQSIHSVTESSPLQRSFKLRQIVTLISHSIQRISIVVAQLFVQTFNYAENAPLQVLTIPELTSPPLWQWSYPLLLLILIVISP